MSVSRKARFFDNLMSGGEAPKIGIVPQDIVRSELERGIEVEGEHSPDRLVRQKIALDHFAELGDEYYIGLDLIERIIQAGLLRVTLEMVEQHTNVKVRDLLRREDFINGRGRRYP